MAPNARQAPHPTPAAISATITRPSVSAATSSRPDTVDHRDLLGEHLLLPGVERGDQLRIEFMSRSPRSDWTMSSEPAWSPSFASARVWASSSSFSAARRRSSATGTAASAAPSARLERGLEPVERRRRVAHAGVVGGEIIVLVGQQETALAGFGALERAQRAGERRPGLLRPRDTLDRGVVAGGEQDGRGNQCDGERQPDRHGKDGERNAAAAARGPGRAAAKVGRIRRWWDAPTVTAPFVARPVGCAEAWAGLAAVRQRRRSAGLRLLMPRAGSERTSDRTGSFERGTPKRDGAAM